MNIACSRCGTENRTTNIPVGRLPVCGHCRNFLGKDAVVTHYDVLKISRHAPVEVIAAAYKSLAKKHHPDVNSRDRDATRILQELNESYAVLSDPTQRKEHDSWIDGIDQESKSSNNSYNQSSHSQQYSSPQPVPTGPTPPTGFVGTLGWIGFLPFGFLTFSIGSGIAGHVASLNAPWLMILIGLIFGSWVFFMTGFWPVTWTPNFKLARKIMLWIFIPIVTISLLGLANSSNLPTILLVGYAQILFILGCIAAGSADQ